MEVKVGIQHVNREIVVETQESAADGVKRWELRTGKDVDAPAAIGADGSQHREGTAQLNCGRW